MSVWDLHVPWVKVIALKAKLLVLCRHRLLAYAALMCWLAFSMLADRWAFRLSSTSVADAAHNPAIEVDRCPALL